MATWPNQAARLLTCLFTVYREVSTFKGEGDCLDYSCIGSYCTCIEWAMPGWSIGLVTVIGIGVGVGCLTVLFKCCCAICKDPEETDREEVAIHMPTLPPAFTPPVPTAPPEQESMDPPPYSEVAWKLPCYPTPEGQPPAYDNIALHISEPPAYITER
uniref:transmembrane protein 92 n=1 Tax=Podarcis muralis TaxID=64176 RepID=UPI0010A070FB|nr:transmembrane protein 92 [Podarcis muralis]